MPAEVMFPSGILKRITSAVTVQVSILLPVLYCAALSQCSLGADQQGGCKHASALQQSGHIPEPLLDAHVAQPARIPPLAQRDEAKPYGGRPRVALPVLRMVRAALRILRGAGHVQRRRPPANLLDHELRSQPAKYNNLHSS